MKITVRMTIISEFSMNKKPDSALANKWTSHEKDSLRKYILIFGYGRWKIIKYNSGGVLIEKTEQELKVFSNAFIRTIIEFLPLEKSELKKFLVNLIDEKSDDPFIVSKRDDWGTLIKQRAPAWGKRIQLIYRVCLIIEKFKSERKKNKEIRKNLDEGIEKRNEIVEKLKSELNKTYGTLLLNQIIGTIFLIFYQIMLFMDRDLQFGGLELMI